jgi:response regulator NasT
VILIDTESPRPRRDEQDGGAISRDQPRPIVFTDEHDPGVMRQAIQRRQRLYRRGYSRPTPAADPRWAMARFESDQALRAQLQAMHSWPNARNVL